MKNLIENDRFYVKKRAPKSSIKEAMNSSQSEYELIRKEVLDGFSILLPKLNFKKNRKQQAIDLKIAEDFSVFTNPFYVLNIIGQFTQHALQKKINKVNIDQSEMSKHDLTSEVLIAQAALALKADKSKRGKTLSINGTFPKNRDFEKLIRAIGIVKQVKSIIVRDHSVVDAKVFNARGKIDEKTNLMDGDKKGSVLSNFIDHMNESLSMVSKKLTDDSEADLIEILGELIGNAEDHSGSNDSHWQFYGYTDKNSKGEIYQQVTIFNFGNSIAQSMKKSMHKEVVSKRVRPYIDYHKAYVPEDILYTIQALQENVSSKLDEQIDRGQGFTDLLLFFEDIARECSNGESNHIEMSIISGNVSIFFDGKYLPVKSTTYNRHLIYFNDSNDPNKIPDSKYVKIAKDISFPGTIITIKYRLREEDYENDEV